MESWKSFEKEVAESILTNSKIFLRRAADEIARHDDGNDAPFDHETGTIVTVLTQMALELGMAAFLVEHKGIRSILDSPAGLTDEQIREKWLSNSLRTKKFEQNKLFFAKEYGGVWSGFDGIVDLFQQSRNKIVHIHFRFSQGDLYDLKFESTYVLMRVVSYFVFGSDYNHADNIASLLSKETLEKLVGFSPYQAYVQRLAQNYASPALRCPNCRQTAFAGGAELKCFSCGYQHPHMILLDCPACSEHSVIYDKLNLFCNKVLPTSCLNCGDKQDVSQCKWCREAFLVSGSRSPYCSQDCIDDEKSKLDVPASA